MKILKDSINTNFLNENDLVLDIETSGVSRTNSKVLVVGMLFSSNFKEENFIQVFIENEDDEKKLLLESRKYLSGKYIYTFNGEIFDLPFINSRLASYGLDDLAYLGQFDLYRYLIKNKDLVDVEKFSLQDIEKAYGIERFEDFEIDYDNKFYEDFLEDKNTAVVLLHNKNDVLNTEKLIGVKNEIEKEKTFDLHVGGEKSLGKIGGITINKDFLIVEVEVENTQKYRFENKDYYIDVDGKKCLIKLKVIKGYIGDDRLGFVHAQKIKPYIKNDGAYKIADNFLLIYTDGKFELKNIILLIQRLIFLFIK